MAEAQKVAVTIELVKAVIERSTIGRATQNIAKAVGLPFAETAYIVDQFRYGQNARQIVEKMNAPKFRL
jgi:hypothetical protein